VSTDRKKGRCGRKLAFIEAVERGTLT